MKNYSFTNDNHDNSINHYDFIYSKISRWMDRLIN